MRNDVLSHRLCKIRRLARRVGRIAIPISLLKEISVLKPDPEELPWFEWIYLKMTNKKKGDFEKSIRIKDEVCSRLEEKLKTQL